MSTFIPNKEAVLDKELRDHDHDRDLAWVRERLDRAKTKMQRLEYEWQNSGGYGSRSAITKCDNEIKLLRLALRGLETGCHRCDMRWRNISHMTDTLKSEKKAGIKTVDIDRAIDMIKSLF